MLTEKFDRAFAYTHNVHREQVRKTKETPYIAHLMAVAKRVATAIDTVYSPEKVGVVIAGLEVPHVHIHVAGINGISDLDFAGADHNPNAVDLDDARARLSDAMAG